MGVWNGWVYGIIESSSSSEFHNSEPDIWCASLFLRNLGCFLRNLASEDDHAVEIAT